MISFLVRYNWAYINGLIKEIKEHEGLVYRDMVAVNLDETVEYALSLSEKYNMAFNYVMDDMYYSDVTVLYAKMANNSAFESYNSYINMSDESRNKYVADYGEPRPYVYMIVTPEIQEQSIEESKNKLKQMYKSGGKLNE